MLGGFRFHLEVGKPFELSGVRGAGDRDLAGGGKDDVQASWQALDREMTPACWLAIDEEWLLWGGVDPETANGEIADIVSRRGLRTTRRSKEVEARRDDLC